MSFTSQSYLFSFSNDDSLRTNETIEERAELGDVKYTHKPVRVSGSGQRSAYIEGQKLSMMTGICFAASLRSTAIISQC